MKLEGKVALVTGGGRGIGRGCSLALAGLGADVAMTYRKNDEAANETRAEIEKLGRRAWAVQCDVCVEEDIVRMTGEVLEAAGRLDILICNAGIASRGNTIRETSTKEMRRVLDTHVMGSFWCCREAIPALRESGDGRIVLMSSVATLGHGARGGPYSMAKSAVESLAKTLCKEEGPHGIRVNCIAPGLVETEMGRRLVQAREGVDIKDLYSTYPFGRVGQPEDIGNLAAFLCSAEGGYVSGQVVYVNGGGFQRSDKIV